MRAQATEFGRKAVSASASLQNDEFSCKSVEFLKLCENVNASLAQTTALSLTVIIVFTYLLQQQQVHAHYSSLSRQGEANVRFVQHWRSHREGALGAGAPQESTHLLKIVPKCTKTRHFHAKNKHFPVREHSTAPSPDPVSMGRDTLPYTPPLKCPQSRRKGPPYPPAGKIQCASLPNFIPRYEKIFQFLKKIYSKYKKN